MRILILGINFSPEPIGAGKYTGEMAKWLATRGHDVRVVTAPPHYPHWRIAEGYSGWRYRKEGLSFAGEAGGVRRRSKLVVWRCPVWMPREPRGMRRVFHLASFGLSSWPPMLRQLTWRPDIVLLIEPTLFCSLQALLLGWCTGAKKWLHVQDFEVDAAFQLGGFSSLQARRWANWIERLLMQSFDRVSTLSDRMVERLVRKGVPPSLCSLFPNWVDTAAIYPLPGPSPMRRELGISEHKLAALYSGNMGHKQGLDLLVEVARQLVARSDIRFVFCGDGSCRQALVQSAQGMPNIMFLPLQPVDRLNDLLNLADIHLLPQSAEASDLVMPSKLTSMLASGRPVIASAPPETQLAKVVQGRGVVVPPGDATCMVSAIARLADEPGLRHQMGREARRYAVSYLNRDDVLVRFERSISEACGKKRGVIPIHAA